MTTQSSLGAADPISKLHFQVFMATISKSQILQVFFPLMDQIHRGRNQIASIPRRILELFS
ncbi:hypothetical protein CDL12_07608 [Handroanthus impetiginosus]|uniref:Uncharacterized protein n=1 Tax=Handroanthus impetiginosus TaxID=429701 RepID=A0A2G9HQA6_9LAMI|nr:hypothetical protein CDL12_07608 [Handroanthus impetiginosus]